MAAVASPPPPQQQQPHMNLTPLPADPENNIPAHTDSRPEARYAGPSMGYLLRTHKLAHQIIATHHLAPAAGSILDANNLVFLRAYAADPSPTGVERLLRSRGMWDERGLRETAEKAGAGGGHGSLVGYAIATGALGDEESLGLLRAWFGSGVLDAELEGVEMPGKHVEDAST